MSDLHGQYVWYELMTSDLDAALAFYGTIVGWDAVDAGMPGMRYMLLRTQDGDVGGAMAIPPPMRDSGMRPFWMGHVAVDDVDASAAEVSRLGGEVHRGPADIPGVGRFAVVTDPHGARFSLFKSAIDGAFQPAKPGVPGHIGWHELFAGDREQAFDFYAALFGWTRDAAFDMGAMGVYQLFATGGPAVGAMMTKPPALPAPAWLYDFIVDDVDAAKIRVEDNGGKALMGPVDVPGGSRIVQCLDPQGANFALVQPPR
jgi:predicted enzyme related to lactoylglutathione lyase